MLSLSQFLAITCTTYAYIHPHYISITIMFVRWGKHCTVGEGSQTLPRTTSCKIAISHIHKNGPIKNLYACPLSDHGQRWQGYTLSATMASWRGGCVGGVYWHLSNGRGGRRGYRHMCTYIVAVRTSLFHLFSLLQASGNNIDIGN